MNITKRQARLMLTALHQATEYTLTIIDSFIDPDTLTGKERILPGYAEDVRYWRNKLKAYARLQRSIYEAHPTLRNE